jgi:hypothetical protein
VFSEEGGPEDGVVQIGVEGVKEVRVEEDFAAFEFLPCSVGFGGGYGGVYPAWGDVKGEFVVEDCLEGGDDLWGC